MCVQMEVMRRRIHVCPKGSHEEEDTCVSKEKILHVCATHQRSLWIKLRTHDPCYNAGRYFRKKPPAPFGGGPFCPLKSPLSSPPIATESFL
jgi:hypothetical protein